MGLLAGPRSTSSGQVIRYGLVMQLPYYFFDGPELKLEIRMGLGMRKTMVDFSARNHAFMPKHTV